MSKIGQWDVTHRKHWQDTDLCKYVQYTHCTKDVENRSKGFAKVNSWITVLYYNLSYKSGLVAIIHKNINNYEYMV